MPGHILRGHILSGQVVAILALGIAALLALCGPAQAQGDARNGRALARSWCTSCHLVEPSGLGSDTAPPFAIIALLPAIMALLPDIIALLPDIMASPDITTEGGSLACGLSLSIRPCSRLVVLVVESRVR